MSDIPRMTDTTSMGWLISTITRDVGEISGVLICFITERLPKGLDIYFRHKNQFFFVLKKIINKLLELCKQFSVSFLRVCSKVTQEDKS